MQTDARPDAAAPGAPSGLRRFVQRAALPVAFLATKLKWLAVLVKFKGVATLLSAVVTIGTYALFYGLPFAVGFVALIFVHELGHVFALRRRGIPSTAVLFIPFVGALVGMRRLPDNAAIEAEIALAGPVLGSLGAFAVLAAWGAFGHPLLLALAYSGLLINLFNLIPVSPLDGGRAMAALSPWGWGIGLVLLIAVVIATHSPVLIVILLLGGFEVLHRFRSWRGGDRSYYAVPPRTRAAVAAAFFGLAAVLALTLIALDPALHAAR